MPAWTAGIQIRKDASGDIHVDLDSSTPCWNEAVAAFCLIESKFPPHSVFRGAYEDHEVRKDFSGSKLLLYPVFAATMLESFLDCANFLSTLSSALSHSGEGRNPGWVLDPGADSADLHQREETAMDTGFRRYDRKKTGFHVWLRLCRTRLCAAFLEVNSIFSAGEFPISGLPAVTCL
jgi:hypothetical protein